MRRRFSGLAAAALLALTAPLLAACASGGGAPGTGAPGAPATGAATGIVLENGWVKAGEAGGMTGVFGTLVNDGGEAPVITGVESDAAETVELHEVVDGEMREIDGEVSIPAQGSYELAPGADHIMLMGLTRELLAGDEITVTVHFRSGGAEYSEEFTVPVKDYAGANESYGDLSHGDTGSHGADGHGADGHGAGEHGAGEHGDSDSGAHGTEE